MEPPTPPTWHKPEESTTPGSDKDRNVTPEINNSNNKDNNDKTSSSIFTSALDSEASPNTAKEINVPTSSPSTERGTEAETLSSTISSVISGDGSPAPAVDIADLELKGDMEALLDVLHEVYVNMIALVGSYQENNEEVRNQEYSSEGKLKYSP